MTFAAVTSKVSRTLRALKRPRTTGGLIRQAELYRREGRYAEAGQLVTRALQLSPRHVLAHLLRAYLHVACRETSAAKTAFAQVLALDAHQPRALLGLGRIAIEEGDVWNARTFLERALKLYPEFPEAAALLDILADAPPRTVESQPASPPDVSATPVLRLTPVGARDLVLARADGTLVVAEADAQRRDDLAGGLAQIFRIAAATAARCGLGAVEGGVIETADERTFARTDGNLVLGVTFPRAVELGFGLLAVDNLWTDSIHTARVPA
jgi:tetratricopeptide (TPR) repeat protein